jgi:aarF domain-containing kinase
MTSMNGASRGKRGSTSLRGLLGTLFLLLSWVSLTTGASSNPPRHVASSSTVVEVVDTPDIALERAAYVRQVLLQRLQHVSSGRRMKDIVKWIQQNSDGEATIFSTHGTETDNMDMRIMQVLEHSDDAEECITAKDPFSSNRMHLGLVSPAEAPPNQFPGPPQHLIDSRPPNLFQLYFRAVRLGIHFLPVMSTVGIALVSPTFRQSIWYKWVASCIGSSGAAWIKWGQWSSTRNDMFPDALCRELSTLHSDAPAHGFGFSQEQMESSLGLAPDTLRYVFDSFEEEPLASGSIAQVHRAVLNGKLLAVKIRHPKVARLIDMDFRLMTTAARLFDYLPGLRWLRVSESVEQFSSTMAAQAHLHVEAYHLEVLNYNFRNWKTTSFPQPFYASSSVIIETFEPGVVFGKYVEEFDKKARDISEANGLSPSDNPKVQEVDQDSNETSLQSAGELHGYDIFPFETARFIMTTGLNLYLKMLLVDNLMHADLHPGNIIFSIDQADELATMATAKRAMAMINNLDNQSRQDMKITLVDAGMVAQLTDDESSTFIGLLAALGAGDGREAAIFAMQFSLENQRSPEEKEAFALDMIELFKERCRGYGTNVDVGEVLRGVLGVIRKHQVRVDANFATLVVNVLCIEGLARSVLPYYNVLDAARPLLETYRKLCYEADGTPKSEARRSRRTKLIMSLMYAKKTLLDKTLFQIARKKAEKRTQQFQSIL